MPDETSVASQSAINRSSRIAPITFLKYNIPREHSHESEPMTAKKPPKKIVPHNRVPHVLEYNCQTLFLCPECFWGWLKEKPPRYVYLKCPICGYCTTIKDALQSFLDDQCDQKSKKNEE